MGAAAPIAALGQLGLGVYNAFQGPQQMAAPLPPSYSTPQGTQFYNPSMGGYEYLANQSPEQYRQGALSQLLESKIMGQDYGDWQQGLQGRISELEGLLGGLKVEPAGGYESWLQTPEGQNSYGPYGSESTLGKAQSRKEYNKKYGVGGQGVIDTAKNAEYQQELDALRQAMGAEDINLPYGSLLAASPERQLQIGEQTGSYQDLLSKASEEQFSGLLSDLARRGMTGGTTEFELGERQAESASDIAKQSAMFGEQLRNADIGQLYNLLSAVRGGMGAGEAQQFAGQQAAAGYQQGAQRLMQQQAYQQAIMDAQRNASLQDVLGMAGAGMSEYGDTWQNWLNDLLGLNRNTTLGTSSDYDYMG